MASKPTSGFEITDCDPQNTNAATLLHEDDRFHDAITRFVNGLICSRQFAGVVTQLVVLAMHEEMENGNGTEKSPNTK